MSTQALVQEWLRLDQNPTTRDEIAQLATNGNETELRKRLATRIEFGTAGLRGRMEAGFSRMNDLTVIQASQGLCAYVLQHVGDAKEKGVVIGHDHRHHSERWALLTATAFVARGMKAYLHRGLVHTPLVPFSVKRLGAACGVMITASHNPKNDNGYKVYWGNGVQIIEPHDKGIASSIKENLEPGVDAWKTDGLLENPLCIDRTEDMIRLYLTHLASFSYTRELNVTTDVTFVNTSMHGVGNRFAAKAFEVYGLRPYLPVESQMEPDPDFPTVAFPNPEEHGALKLALETAGNHKADYVLAQDPDADRFTAAERGSDGTWTQFSGDQLGTLLAAWTLLKYQASGEPIEKLAMVASTVSSKMIGGMAKREGFKFTESLTGFKYIGNTALDLQAKGFSVPFGYEEAIGFMIGDEIRDKDGVNATVAFAELVVYLRAQGQSVSSYLTELYDRYGHYKTNNSYFICYDPATIDKIFNRLRNWPATEGSIRSSNASYPSNLGDLPITAVRDLTNGYGFDSSNIPSLEPELPLSLGHMITFRANQDGIGLTLTIRTSGTEPKIKYYLEGTGEDPAQVTSLLDKVVEELRVSWMEASANGLREP